MLCRQVMLILCFPCILPGSPIRTSGDFILPGENYDVVAFQKVSVQPQLTAAAKLPDHRDVVFQLTLKITHFMILLVLSYLIKL